MAEVDAHLAPSGLNSAIFSSNTTKSAEIAHFRKGGSWVRGSFTRNPYIFVISVALVVLCVFGVMIAFSYSVAQWLQSPESCCLTAAIIGVKPYRSCRLAVVEGLMGRGVVRGRIRLPPLWLLAATNSEALGI